MALNWCKGTIVNKTIWADGLFTLHVSVKGVQEFEPGQFLQLGHERGDEHIHRPYSVASPWGKVLDFFIVRVDGGQLTPYLWDLQPGSNIDINHRATGRFTLGKAPPAKVLWLVATGTGLAPYIAMLRTEQPWIAYQKIVLVHGARVASDLAYVEELRQMEEDHEGHFSYVPSLTRDDSAMALHGRIPNLLQDGQLEQRAGCLLSPENSAVMLCGNPAMLDSMEDLLGKREMIRHRSKTPGHIVLERYW